MSALQAVLDRVNSSHAVLADYLREHPDRQPTFESNGPLELANAPAHVNDARHALASAARDLQLLALYPTEAVNYLGLEVNFGLITVLQRHTNIGTRELAK